MKIKSILLSLAAVMFTLSLTACGGDDDFVLPEAVSQAFASQYPNTVAKWSLEGQNYKAEFVKDQREVDAWYRTDGTWVKTETDLLVTDLPATLATRIHTDYPDWTIDDVDFIETPALIYYEVELKKSGAADQYVYITPLGEYVTP